MKLKNQEQNSGNVENISNPVPQITTTPQKAGRRAIKKENKANKKIFFLGTLVSVVSVGLIGIAAFFLHAILEERDSMNDLPVPDFSNLELQEEIPTLNYLGMRIPIHQEVAVNSYDPRGFFVGENNFTRYEVGEERGIIGIDVSYHQKTINWAEVAAAGVEFAMIRAGRRGYGEDGNLGEDSHYRENIQGALENGIEVGVYFFSQALNISEAEEEVALLLQLIEGYSITYPVVFDWEFITESELARTDEVTGEEITEIAKYFCDRVDKAGYQAGVYFNTDMAYRYLDLSQLTNYPFWLAELNPRPNFYYHFDMWQYSFTGQVAGIEGDVDLNISFHDFANESWEKPEIDPEENEN